MRKLVLGLALLLAAGGSSLAQDYPNRSVRLVVPFAPGGSTDTVARVLAAKLSQRWTQQVVVDNRPGGSTIVGTDVVAKAAPDGYTLLLGGSPLAINPGLFPNLPYEALRDFRPIAFIAAQPSVLVAHPSLPANTIPELIALAKSQPGKLNYASSGTGGTNHLAGELFRILAGIDFVHVPYRGQGPATNDLVGGQIEMMIGGTVAALPLVRSGRVKALGVTSAVRSDAAPDIPSITETLPGYEAVAWFGVLAPAATPDPIIQQLHREISAALADPELRTRLDNEGAQLRPMKPEEFGALIAADTKRWTDVVKTAGIKAE